MFRGKRKHSRHSNQNPPRSFGTEAYELPFFTKNSSSLIQQKAATPFFQPGTYSSIESRLNEASGSGNPIPARTKTQMENSFGTDFSNVRLHTDDSAVQMNKDLHAEAFTHGSDIYFNSGKYKPDTSAGKHLLAHELTHVAQQGKTGKAGVSRSEDKTMVQLQPQQEEREPKDISQSPTQQPAPANKPLRIGSCLANPEFPDFGCFAAQLKLNVDQNLINNAHRFLQIATLYPGDSKLMWDTFLRYGMGVNLLQTSFRFLGTDRKWSNILSYGTGIGMKAYQFTQTGQLKLDFQIPLKKDLNLDIKFDLNADPNDPTKINGVDSGIGISGRF